MPRRRGEAQHSEKLGSRSPPGLPKTQKTIWRTKTPRIEVFLVSLERAQNVDVENALAFSIWTSVAQVMGKRRAGSETGSLTPDQEKSRIDPLPKSNSGVRHGVEKITTRATTSVQTSSRSKLRARRVRPPKVPGVQNRDTRLDFGFPTRESREFLRFGCGCGGASQSIL